MVLSCHGAGEAGAAPQPGAVSEQLRGLPEGSALSSYFVLMKQGNDFTALPVEQLYGFRPVVLCVLRRGGGGMACVHAGWARALGLLSSGCSGCLVDRRQKTATLKAAARPHSTRAAAPKS
jgi:hypothetical protein